MINRFELKNAAKQQIKGNIGILFVCFLIVMVISGVGSTIPFVAFLIMPPFSLGIAMIFLGLARGEGVEIGTVFKGFNQFGQSVLLGILITVFTFLWSLLFLIPGIIKGLSYSMSYFILAENPEMSASEALNQSKSMMKGHKWDLFVLYLSFILWGILGCITCGIAYIYIIPYIQATVTNFYNAIKVIPQTVSQEVI